MARGKTGPGTRKGSSDLSAASALTEAYQHPEASLLARPEVGNQARFKKKKPKATYRYDSSLAPEMNWDGQNPAREHGEWLIGCIEDAAKLKDADPPFAFKSPRQFTSADGRVVASVSSLADATAQLKRLSAPFLNWAGKAERLSFDVPTLPLFVHERLSTQAIIDTLKSHRKDAAQTNFLDLFGDPQRSLADAIVKAYEHRDKWVNQLILGDSLVVMNSLLQYEGLGGQIQMIYIDPPYGVKFGSNFQPFVREKDVSNADDADMTREPEMVRAYRDTWELGLHSYLAYLRDRLLLARDLLHPTGSVFIQISDTNLHTAREVAESVFGGGNFCSIIPFAKTASTATTLLNEQFDYLLWFAREKARVKYRQLHLDKTINTFKSYKYIVNQKNYEIHALSREMKDNPRLIPEGFKVAQLSFAVSQEAGKPEERIYYFKGKNYDCGAGRHWKTTNPTGLDKLAKANRLVGLASQLNYIRYLSDFPATPLTNLWSDTGSAGYSNADPKVYVVQTDTTVIERCVLMTTDPGDLVFDPTCGSGTTAYVAERWGRRWITADTSRVPLALARQRLSTATFPYFELADSERGPSGGFIYKRRVDRDGEEIGGILPHITLEGIANDEPAEEVVLFDRPEKVDRITRVSGPFCVEATIPTPLDLDGDGEPDDGTDIEDRTSFVDRLLDTLRRAPNLQLGQGRSVTLKNIRLPAKTLALSAEAMVDAIADGQNASLADAIAAADEKNRNALPLSQRPVAIVFGPESGAVSERLVYEAAQEAAAKRYTHLYVIGFAIQPNAEQMISQCEAIFGVPAMWVAVTPDVVMGDLLKTTRASQIFSIAGRPEIEVTKLKPQELGEPPCWQAKLGGLNTFDPVTMKVDRLKGDDVPCWMLDPNYNGRVFMATQVFFPRTKAWENIKKALKATHDESVWDHLAGDTSAPFEAGEHATIAVKVIDDRGNELMVVRKLAEAAE